jgi:hypothetical protein
MAFDSISQSVQEVYPIFCQSWSSAHVLQWLNDLQTEMRSTEWGPEDRARVWPMFLKKNAETWGIDPFWLDVLSYEWAMHLVKTHQESSSQQTLSDLSSGPHDERIRLNSNAQILQQRFHVRAWLDRGANPEQIPKAVDPTLVVIFKASQLSEVSELKLNPTQALILDEILESPQTTMQSLAFHLKDLVNESVWSAALMDLKERGLIL